MSDTVLMGIAGYIFFRLIEAALVSASRFVLAAFRRKPNRIVVKFEADTAGFDASMDAALKRLKQVKHRLNPKELI